VQIILTDSKYKGKEISPIMKYFGEVDQKELLLTENLYRELSGKTRATTCEELLKFHLKEIKGPGPPGLALEIPTFSDEQCAQFIEEIENKTLEIKTLADDCIMRLASYAYRNGKKLFAQQLLEDKDDDFFLYMEMARADDFIPIPYLGYPFPRQIDEYLHGRMTQIEFEKNLGENWDLITFEPNHRFKKFQHSRRIHEIIFCIDCLLEKKLKLDEYIKSVQNYVHVLFIYSRLILDPLLLPDLVAIVHSYCISTILYPKPISKKIKKN